MFLPDKGMRYPKKKGYEIISQIYADDEESYIEVYLKDCKCGDERCEADKFVLIWHNDMETSEWFMDERDMKDTITVLSTALSVDENRRVGLLPNKET